MEELFLKLEYMNPYLLVLLATGITWGMTILGATSVFFIKRISRKKLHIMLGFAAGEMLAAAFWSLLNHSISMTLELGETTLIQVAVGFLLGGFFIWSLQHSMPIIHRLVGRTHRETITPEVRAKVVVADVFVYYLPEGLALGIAFGAVYHHFEFVTIASAVGLMIGLGTQNILESAAIAVPLTRLGITKRYSFTSGVVSGVVQPLAGLIGAWIVINNYMILPFAFAFAAGALIYGVVEELLPAAFKDDHRVIATTSLMVGFSVMMIIKVLVG